MSYSTTLIKIYHCLFREMIANKVFLSGVDWYVQNYVTDIVDMHAEAKWKHQGFAF